MLRLGLICTFILLAGCMPKPSELVFEDSQMSNTAPAGYDRTKSLAAFRETVYPIVNGQTCVNCHNSSSAGQSPIFADDNIEKAFDAITMSKKVDLMSPESSRIVLKLKTQSHNCWTSNCEADSDVLLAAIKRWKQLAPNEGAGFFTDSKELPGEHTALPAQTEYGTVLVQAEQELYQNEVIEGRFVEDQDSNAQEGKYITMAPPEANPHTVTGRSLSIDSAQLNSCREFTEADLMDGSRLLKIFESRVHIPSGQTDDQGKIVKDGYRPYATSLSMSIIRPDKRLEYAKMLVNNDFTNIFPVLLHSGDPAGIIRQEGAKLPDTFGGVPRIGSSGISVLPHFTHPSQVYKPDGSFVTSGTFKKDDGTDESLYNLFKDGGYLPSEDIIQKKLLENPNYKVDIAYKSYKDLVKDFFYISGSRRKADRNISYYYNKQIYGMDLIHYFQQKVDIEMTCPDEAVNPSLPISSTNPKKNCTANPNYYRYHVVEEAGPVLVQGNALDCYSLNSNQTDFVKVNDSYCDGRSSRYFHLIDLYVHFTVNSPSVLGRIVLNAYESTTPTSYTDVEVYSTASSRSLAFNFAGNTTDELDPDVFFSGGGERISEGLKLVNFEKTLHKTLRQTRCIDCHGDGSGIPQFASASASASYSALEMNGLINFISPSNSFRPNGMVHQCDPSSSDPRYSCADADETKLRESLIAGITEWNKANQAAAASEGVKSFRSLTRNERLPGRAKYKLKVTSPGIYNVWMKVKKITGGSSLNFRLLDSNGNAVSYFRGTNTSSAGSCFRWGLDTTDDAWQWTSPGRTAELASLDHRGYLLLNDQKQTLPLPNERLYYSLSEGEYTLDIIGLTANLNLDVVGLNKVENHSPDARLAFQPDRRAIDEKHVSDYKRKILEFDLSKMLNLQDGKKAYFKVEVRREFKGQNYIFRNPRFVTSPRDFNIKVKGMKVHINGKHNYPDATFNNFEGVVGDDRVITYAPLVALTDGPNDMISFKFDEIAVTQNGLSDLFPKGTPPAEIVDRRCNELDFFIKNVKPILRNARVTLTGELVGALNGFPGSPRDIKGGSETYKCISCHTANHPYFKMANFTNNEEFCREALSRVDFQNFYQSLVIRGINGTGNHPKFVFTEKFVIGSDGNFKVHDGKQDYLHGRDIVETSEGNIATQPFIGPRLTWSKAELGISASKTQWDQLTTNEKKLAPYIGKFKTLEYEYVDMDVINYAWYDPETHSRLIYDRTDPSSPDNKLSARDVIHPDPAIGRLESNRSGNNGPPVVYSISGFKDGLPAVATSEDPIPFKGDFKSFNANGRPGYDKTTTDFIASTPEKNTIEEMLAEQEILRDYYREVVIEWIRRENAARLKE